MCGSRGRDRESGPPLKNHKNIRCLSNTDPYRPKNHKSYKPAFSVGPPKPTSKMPFKWRFAGRPMMVRLYWFLDPLSLNQLKKECKKVGPPLKKLSGSAHEFKVCTKKLISLFLYQNICCRYQKKHLKEMAF